MTKYGGDLVPCDWCLNPAAELFPDEGAMICADCANEVDSRPVCDVCDARTDAVFQAADGLVCPECFATADDRARWREADIQMDEKRDRERYESDDYSDAE
jgi:hypothetical protein